MDSKRPPDDYNNQGQGKSTVLRIPTIEISEPEPVETLPQTTQENEDENESLNEGPVIEDLEERQNEDALLEEVEAIQDAEALKEDEETLQVKEIERQDQEIVIQPEIIQEAKLFDEEKVEDEDEEIIVVEQPRALCTRSEERNLEVIEVAVLTIQSYFRAHRARKMRSQSNFAEQAQNVQVGPTTKQQKNEGGEENKDAAKGEEKDAEEDGIKDVEEDGTKDAEKDENNDVEEDEEKDENNDVEEDGNKAAEEEGPKDAGENGEDDVDMEEFTLDLDDPCLNKAAIKIQAIFRGYLARRTVAKE